MNLSGLLSDTAHEIVALAQIPPGTGIADAADRVQTALECLVKNFVEREARVIEYLDREQSQRDAGDEGYAYKSSVQPHTESLDVLQVIADIRKIISPYS